MRPWTKSKKYGSPSLPDEELILRFHAGPEFVDALKPTPPRKEYLDARKPLVLLIEEIIRKRFVATSTYPRAISYCQRDEYGDGKAYWLDFLSKSIFKKVVRPRRHTSLYDGRRCL